MSTEQTEQTKFPGYESVQNVKEFDTSIPKEPRQEYLDDNEEITKLLNFLTPQIQQYNIKCGTPSKNKLYEWRHPTQLQKEFNFELQEQPTTVEEIFPFIEKIFKYSVAANQPRFFDKLYAGTLPIGQAAELIMSVLNNNVHTYGVSPVFAIMENYCVKKFAELCDFPEETHDGIFVPGGTLANITALIVARHKTFPHVREQGWQKDDEPVMFCSVQSHYSVARGAMIAGVGIKSGCLKIKALQNGTMDTEDLEKQIQDSLEAGKKPFCISATSGTTVMGAFENLEAIGKIAKKYNIWFHVDACWGCSALFSPKLRHLMKGIEMADSVSMDPHKPLGVPLQTTLLLVNGHKGLLQASNSSGAVYLFHKHDASEYDLGDKTLQCGRRADSLKMWLTWKRLGQQGFCDRVETSYSNAQYFKQELVKRTDSYRLVAKETHFNVCFWYIPPVLRGFKNIEDIYPQLNAVTQLMYAREQKCGNVLINFNPLEDHGLPRFLRIVLINDKVKPFDMTFVLDELDRIGSDITMEEIEEKMENGCKFVTLQ